MSDVKIAGNHDPIIQQPETPLPLTRADGSSVENHMLHIQMGKGSDEPTGDNRCEWTYEEYYLEGGKEVLLATGVTAINWVSRPASSAAWYQGRSIVGRFKIQSIDGVSETYIRIKAWRHKDLDVPEGTVVKVIRVIHSTG